MIIYIYIEREIYIQRKKLYENPFTLLSLFNNMSVSEWAVSVNSGSNINRTETDEGGMDITYRLPLYFIVFQLVSL